MIKFVLTFCLSIMFVQLNGQIEATTTNDKKVLLFEDGTWKYMKTNRIHSIDCMQLTSIAEDTTAGGKYISSSGNVYVSKNGEKGFRISIKKIFSEEYTGFYFKVIGGGCIGDNPMIEILFRDDTKSNFFADSKNNCENDVYVLLGGKYGREKYLEQIRKKEIKTMRIHTNNSYVQENFTVENSRELINILVCILGRP